MEKFPQAAEVDPPIPDGDLDRERRLLLRDTLREVGAPLNDAEL